MTGQEALCLVDTLLHAANQGQKLNDVQSAVFLETWAGRSYGQIAEQLGYEYDYIKQVGSRLWRSLSPAVGEKVSKRNIQAVLRRYEQSSKDANTLPVAQWQQNWSAALNVSEILPLSIDTEFTEEIFRKIPFLSNKVLILDPLNEFLPSDRLASAAFPTKLRLSQSRKNLKLWHPPLPSKA